MAVLFYAEGEHPSGFIGYRVATTLGTSDEFRQKYFGLTEYSPSEAERLAYELDERWRAQADENRRGARLNPNVRRCFPGVIVTGLRADIRVERPRKPTHRLRLTPSFVVQNPDYGKGDKSFPIGKYGFERAYQLAVDTYAEFRVLDEADVKHLLGLIPSRDLFTNTLRLNLLKRGITATSDDIASRLA